MGGPEFVVANARADQRLEIEREGWQAKTWWILAGLALVAMTLIWRTSGPTFDFTGDSRPTLGPSLAHSPWPGFPDWIETCYAVKTPYLETVAAADRQLLSNGWSKTMNLPGFTRYEESGIQRRVIILEKDFSPPAHTEEGHLVRGTSSPGLVGIYLRQQTEGVDFWETTKAWLAKAVLGAP